jgi:hypothetical protein
MGITAGIYKEWILAHCADSAEVNRKIARVMKHHHISCKNHNQNLEAKKMIENDTELKAITTSLNDLSATIRNSCKVSTALRNEAATSSVARQNIRAKGQSATCAWLGEATVVKRHLLLKPYVSKLMDDGIENVADHRECVEHSFTEKTKSHNQYLQQIKACSDILQTPKLLLGKCLFSLDTLSRLVLKVVSVVTTLTTLWWLCFRRI